MVKQGKGLTFSNSTVSDPSNIFVKGNGMSRSCITCEFNIAFTNNTKSSVRRRLNMHILFIRLMIVFVFIVVLFLFLIPRTNIRHYTPLTITQPKYRPVHPELLLANQWRSYLTRRLEQNSSNKYVISKAISSILTVPNSRPKPRAATIGLVRNQELEAMMLS